jgi:hypothetical protein
MRLYGAVAVTERNGKMNGEGQQGKDVKEREGVGYRTRLFKLGQVPVLG